jgi:hypothetical protein
VEINIEKSGKETDPFTTEQTAPMLDSQKLTLSDLIWRPKTSLARNAD